MHNTTPMEEREKQNKPMKNMAMHCDNKNSSAKNMWEISMLSMLLYITHIAQVKLKWSGYYHL